MFKKIKAKKKNRKHAEFQHGTGIYIPRKSNIIGLEYILSELVILTANCS